MIIVLVKGSDSIEVEIDPNMPIQSIQNIIKYKFRIAPELQQLRLPNEVVFFN